MVGVMPNMVGVIPTMVGVVPTMVGVVPTMVGVTPTMVGVVPTMVGMVVAAPMDRWGGLGNDVFVPFGAQREPVRTACWGVTGPRGQFTQLGPHTKLGGNVRPARV